MREQFKAVPEPLQKQVLIRLGFGALFFLLFFALLFMTRDAYSALPCIAMVVFCAINAALLFIRALNNGYVVISGICTDNVLTPVRKRTKAITIRTDKYTVHILVKQQLRKIPVGSILDVYVSSTTPVYERDGIQQLHTYLAIYVKGQDNEDSGAIEPIIERETNGDEDAEKP